ncbi:hypothetical protein BC936DRAFT_147226 [Jimgerdemannia flammicorona]|uniref:Uncharacterized protein n=1 Tax=Jimgerdemannia flammicorona TaxID=994334 RepID=A0A433D5U3_9FUNG|nr:hypothetical protein BC936DRAFT_147226 [Jimgerdemannia flammicorona]
MIGHICRHMDSLLDTCMHVINVVRDSQQRTPSNNRAVIEEMMREKRMTPKRLSEMSIAPLCRSALGCPSLEIPAFSAGTTFPMLHGTNTNCVLLPVPLAPRNAFHASCKTTVTSTRMFSPPSETEDSVPPPDAPRVCPPEPF